MTSRQQTQKKYPRRIKESTINKFNYICNSRWQVLSLTGSAPRSASGTFFGGRLVMPAYWTVLTNTDLTWPWSLTVFTTMNLTALPFYAAFSDPFLLGFSLRPDSWFLFARMKPQCQVFPNVCLLVFQSMTWPGWLKGRGSAVFQVWHFPQDREADMALSKCMRVPRGLLRTEKEEGETVHWVLLSEHAVWEKTICVLSLRD